MVTVVNWGADWGREGVDWEEEEWVWEEEGYGRGWLHVGRGLTRTGLAKSVPNHHGLAILLNSAPGCLMCECAHCWMCVWSEFMDMLCWPNPSEAGCRKRTPGCGETQGSNCQVGNGPKTGQGSEQTQSPGQHCRDGRCVCPWVRGCTDHL